MAFQFTQISDIEFHVNSHVVVKDFNENWIAKPPIDSTQLQKAINNYIINLK